MASLGIAWAVAFVLGLWMLIRIFRGSALMGIACLLIPGAVIFALFKNWGDPDTDIKIPFGLSLLASIWLYFAAVDVAETEFGMVYDPETGEYVVDEDFLESDGFDYAYAAEQMSEEEREQIRQNDPELAAILDAAEQDQRADRAPISSAPIAAPAADEAEESLPPEEQRRRDRQAARSVRLHRGPIEYGPAYSRLETPSHFGFLRAALIKPLARLHGRESSNALLGWVVHERVKLDDDQAWFAEVRFDAVGHLQLESIGSSTELWSAIRAHPDSELAPIHGEGLFGPVWLNERGFAIWQRNLGDGAVEAVATIPLRHGVLSYVVRVPDPSERELAMRTARLLASKTAADAGWRHQDAPADSPARGPTLAKWIVDSSIVAPVESPTDS